MAIVGMLETILISGAACNNIVHCIITILVKH
jgi:hypothetical protein